jgi:hypothetical protein
VLYEFTGPTQNPCNDNDLRQSMASTAASSAAVMSETVAYSQTGDLLTELLASFPENERRAVLEHLRALAAMPAGKRAAMFALTG